MTVEFCSFIGAPFSEIYMFAANDRMKVKVTVTGRGGNCSLTWGHGTITIVESFILDIHKINFARDKEK
jgi:hypothetical protein